MKKVVGILAAALIALPMFTACNSATPKVALTNEADSLNYAFGAANGYAIRENLLAGDTTSADVKAFLKGFDEGYKVQTPLFQKYLDGMRVAMNLDQQMQDGFLVGDSSLIANKTQIYNAIYEVLENKKEFMFTQEEAYTYVSNAISRTRVEGNKFTAGELDSVNIAFGLHNGYQMKQFFLTPDADAAEVKELIKGLKAGSKSDKKDYTLYLNGLQVGAGMYGELSEQGIAGQKELTVDFNIMKAALVAAVQNENVEMSNEEAYDYFMSRLMSLRAAPGQNFLAENAKKEGVITTASGLQYRIIKEGNGPIPTISDKVKVHYEGKLIDGSIFDSSIQRGEPIVFGVTQVIPGWTEILQLMPVGSEYEIYVPYQLGYGERGAGQQIPPYAALVFQIQLLGIEK